MKRIAELFENKKAFVGYLTVGDGGLDKTYESAKALIAGGVNLLELGVPFSDPVADGTVISMASQRALERQVTLLDVLEVAKKLRQETEIPIILFTYFNPLLAYFVTAHPSVRPSLRTRVVGEAIQKKNPWIASHPAGARNDGLTGGEQLPYFNPLIFSLIQAAGIDGILVVDLPVDESSTYRKHCLTANLAPIYVITQATSDDRVKIISSQGKGFLYYACRLGTTGIKQDVPADLSWQIQRIKRLTNLPLVVGFGISTLMQSTIICEIADGFVVGSLFVDAIAKNIAADDLTTLTRKLKKCWHDR